jgi:hypothetical protein
MAESTSVDLDTAAGIGAACREDLRRTSALGALIASSFAPDLSKSAYKNLIFSKVLREIS